MSAVRLSGNGGCGSCASPKPPICWQMSAASTGSRLGTALGRFGVDTDRQTTWMTAVLAALYLAGASLAALTLLLPQSAHANVPAQVALIAVAYLCAAGLRWPIHALSTSTLQYALAFGSVLVTAGAYFTGTNPSPFVCMYLWVALYAAYFLTRRQAVAQIVYVGLLYGLLLTALPPSNDIFAWWLVGVGTLLVASTLVMVMRARVETLIAKLYDAARTDPLTRLSNRRGFRELLDLEAERARRAETNMTLLVGNLDRFQDVNDQLGHHAGDAALQRVAQLLRDHKRQIDVIARVGGGEFGLLLPDTDKDGAFALAERLRCALAEEFSCEPAPLTISFGIATYPLHGETTASLLRAADQALHAAKNGGRNRTVIHSPALRELMRANEEAPDTEGQRFVSVVLDLAEAVDVRFSGSARHSETVGRYAEMMARELGLPEQRVIRVRLAGILHDIGKVCVPNSILHKPGGLTDEEFTIIRRHPELGAQILEHPSLSDVREWVAAHHERPDGRGYPLGLSGDAVPIEAQIVAVADAYEAMTSDRSYRDSIGYAAARGELERCAGTQFDPLVVEAFLAALEREYERTAAVLSAEL
jgi:diguanylate cyclase (GGDEF)-like protein/putative nucleotidyltransferase with HDIG domain